MEGGREGRREGGREGGSGVTEKSTVQAFDNVDNSGRPPRIF